MNCHYISKLHKGYRIVMKFVQLNILLTKIIDLNIFKLQHWIERLVINPLIYSSISQGKPTLKSFV